MYVCGVSLGLPLAIFSALAELSASMPVLHLFFLHPPHTCSTKGRQHRLAASLGRNCLLSPCPLACSSRFKQCLPDGLELRGQTVPCDLRICFGKEDAYFSAELTGGDKSGAVCCCAGRQGLLINRKMAILW